MKQSQPLFQVDMLFYSLFHLYMCMHMHTTHTHTFTQYPHTHAMPENICIHSSYNYYTPVRGGLQTGAIACYIVCPVMMHVHVPCPHSLRFYTRNKGSTSLQGYVKNPTISVRTYAYPCPQGHPRKQDSCVPVQAASELAGGSALLGMDLDLPLNTLPTHSPWWIIPFSNKAWPKLTPSSVLLISPFSRSQETNSLPER